MKKNTTPVVDAIGELNFEGNIIPHSWYQHIKLPVGKRELKRKKGKQTPKADYIAIILLSDVIYWYRPTIRRDELTGEVVSVEKKFYEDMLQKQYETWGELFGFTKIQTRNAVSRLVDAGLLKREFRSITSKSGMKLNNVMFVEPIIEAIKRITFTHPETRAIVEQLPPYLLQSGEVCTLKSAPTLFEVDTNTEITTEITTENLKAASINNPGGPVDEQGKNDAAFEITKKKKQTNPDSSSSFLPGLKANNGNVTPPHSSRPRNNHNEGPATTVINSPPPAEIVGSEYMLAVDKKMAELGICVALSDAESPLVSQMEKEGIPLPLVLGVMDKVFQRNAKSQKGEKIRLFKYFVPAIREAFNARAQPQDREKEYAATRQLIERLS